MATGNPLIDSFFGGDSGIAGGLKDGIGGFFKGILGNMPQDPFTMALNTAQEALKAQKDANLIAASAMLPQADSESARAAGDNQRRKLLSGSSFGIGMPAQLGAPPVGFRLLSGE